MCMNIKLINIANPSVSRTLSLIEFFFYSSLFITFVTCSILTCCNWFVSFCCFFFFFIFEKGRLKDEMIVKAPKGLHHGPIITYFHALLLCFIVKGLFSFYCNVLLFFLHTWNPSTYKLPIYDGISQHMEDAMSPFSVLKIQSWKSIYGCLPFGVAFVHITILCVPLPIHWCKHPGPYESLCANHRKVRRHPIRVRVIN